MFISDYHPISEPLVNPAELSLTEQIIFALDVKPELVGYGNFIPTSSVKYIGGNKHS